MNRNIISIIVASVFHFLFFAILGGLFIYFAVFAANNFQAHTLIRMTVIPIILYVGVFSILYALDSLVKALASIKKKRRRIKIKSFLKRFKKEN